MFEIIKNSVLLARFIKGDSWAQNLSFFSADNEFIQAGTWVYPKGKQLAAHRHNVFSRTAEITQEVIFVRKGGLTAQIYDEAGELVESVKMQTGDMLILLAGGHGYEIEEDGTQVLEVKNGPYAGAEADRVRFPISQEKYHE